MNNQKLKRTVSIAGALLMSVLLAACSCEECSQLNCGDGTMEQMDSGVRSCVVTPIACGDGAHEQATDGQRECVPNDPDDILECGNGTHQQEQATGGQRECVPGASTCAPGEAEIIEDDGTTSCRPEPLFCADGTHEQATGGQRECVLNDANLACGDGTHEQATGGQRECAVGDP